MASKLGAVLLCASVLVGLPVTTRALLSTDIGVVRQQFRAVTSLLGDNGTDDPGKYRGAGQDDRQLADYLDRKKLPDGSVLMDTFMGWLASEQPKQFVVTSDYDFSVALNRPWDFGIQYIVVSNPDPSVTNAIELRYPSIWGDGSGIGELVYSAKAVTGEVRWRVYRVVKPPKPDELSAQLPKPGR